MKTSAKYFCLAVGP